MKISPDGLAITKHYENCHLESYPDPASPLGKECTRRGFNITAYRNIHNWPQLSGSPWTIGWGHTGDEVKPGIMWTQKQCDDALAADMAKFERAVTSAVRVSLNQAQFDALVDFTYNVGPGNLQSSTLLAKLNGGDYASVGKELRRWNKAGGQVMYGLVKRRAAGDARFNGAPAGRAIETGDAQPRP